VAIYVLFRTPCPDIKIVIEVLEKLEETNIDVNQLREVPMNHCQ
jgi:hypothetical protein